MFKRIRHFFHFIKVNCYTRYEKAHSAKYMKRIAILNKYSPLWEALLSVAILLLIETASRHSLFKAVSFLWESPLTFLYNAFVIYVSFMLVYLFKHRAFFRILLTCFWSLLGIINGCVLAKRVTPFGFNDIKCVPELFAMTDSGYFTRWQLILICIAAVLFLFGLTVLAAKMPVYHGRIHPIICAVLAGAMFFIGLPHTTEAAQSQGILDTYYSNIAQGYQDNGFVYSFSSTMVSVGMSEPEDYSEETVEEALVRVEEADLGTTDVTGQSGPNIICVLLESFCDPYEINFLSMDEDPIPTFHALEAGYSTGYMTVPVVGAGTANTEFEVLSGMSLEYFGTGEYPYKTILKQTDCESIASDLSTIGYATHAVHNNGGNFYSRVNSFSMFGFDTFTSKELMDITEFTPTGSWAADSILASETIKTLDATPDQADFTYTITVGTHGAYPTDVVIENPAYTIADLYDEEGNIDESRTNQWTYYINQLNKCDAFIAELIADLEERDEDTIVVLWGDHLPTMGLTDEDMKSGDIYKTKYVTWNNMGLAKEDADLYAYQLLASVTSSVGIHEGTMMTYHQAALASGSTNPITSSYSSYMDGLENLQYDILYGERYCYDGADAYPATEIVMGIDPVTITSVSPTSFEILSGSDDVSAQASTEESTEQMENETSAASKKALKAKQTSASSDFLTDTASGSDEQASHAQDALLLTGSGYTRWAKVYVNGSAVETTYINGSQLMIRASDVKAGDTITVGLVGSKNTIFRSSDEWTME